MKNKMLLSGVAAAAVLLVGCEKSADSFSLMSESSAFKQSLGYSARKVDILWVIDNSGSMATSQSNLASNFNSFIDRFSQLNYDFQMGVITTDAFLGYHYSQNSRSRLRDGANGNFSGVRIIDPNTPNLTQTFITNITQGTNGLGDERGLSSFEHALGNPLNAGFRREGAFLSIIIVSDENDTSHYDWQNGVNSYYYTENASHMFALSRFTTYLDTLTNTIPGGIRNYSVSSISVMDNTCRQQLETDGYPRVIGQRYMDLADLTEGSKGSLCGDFGTTLSMISDRVLELSTVFQLSREPYPETIVVTVNGSVVPQNSTNGWSYNSTNLTISFHGTAVPPAGADVRINFDPKTVQL
jgi:hypothetical protein